ncbi:hypothetical protein [Thermococcus sp. Bubb.Bath]|uniref:hypothetical protein n=1 Tax=Thermococcus sp. Bubb.Bath TaxID=1638242 RepID=UPI001438FE56|nr:hypothetical protein [Thermococcus sp. Bubb.Bath]NJF25354.1 hypothetical protein [Thermococcus sp. Bubb.Bath]
MARAILLIEKSIPEPTRKQIIGLFQKVDNWKNFRYVVIAWLAYFYYRKNKRLRLIPLSVSIAAALFKKKPKEIEDMEDFEVIPLS